MSSVSESYRSRELGAEDHMRPQRRGQSRVHLIIALLGLVTLGYMLWTIAQLLS